jgi:hypothetical protein
MPKKKKTTSSLVVRGSDEESYPLEYLSPEKLSALHPSFLGCKQLPSTVEVSRLHILNDYQLFSKPRQYVSRHKYKHRPAWVNQLLSEYNEDFLREVDSCGFIEAWSEVTDLSNDQADPQRVSNSQNSENRSE